MRKLTYLSTFYHKLAHTAQKHVFSLTVFLIPEEVKVLEGFSWVRGLKLAGVEHEQTHKVQPSHAGRVARLVADCTWEQKGPSDPRNPGPMEIKCISQEA